MTYEEAEKHCIFKFISGSRAYGTERPDSDEDRRGIFIAPLIKAFDLFQTAFVGSGTAGQHVKGAIDSIDVGDNVSARDHLMRALEVDSGDLSMSVGTVKKPGVDEELQELRKFMKLAADSNPSIIEFLYVERGISHEAAVWKKIRSKRDLFLSKKARFTFSGYSMAQLKRIETHRSYLLKPPSKKPERVDFGLSETFTITSEQQNAILCLPDELVAESAKFSVRNEKRFRMAKQEWDSYKKWEVERNQYRKELEAKFGFDVKHAMHLIRLNRMAIEIVRDGIVNVYRPDRDELKGILRGEWKYEDIVNHARKMDVQLEGMYENSPLQNKPDYKGIANMYCEICEEYYGIKIR